MSPKRLILTLAALSILAAPAASHAFQFSGVGATLGYVNPEDIDGAFTIGGHANFDNGGNLRLQPSIHYWNTGAVSDLSPNLDLSYSFGALGRATPYLGAGIGMHMYNSDNSNFSDTNIGANFFGGVSIPGPGTDLFLELRHAATDVTQTSLLGGVTLHIR